MSMMFGTTGWAECSQFLVFFSGFDARRRIFLLLFSLAVLSTTETDLIAEEQAPHYPRIEIEKPHPPHPFSLECRLRRALSPAAGLIN